MNAEEKQETADPTWELLEKLYFEGLSVDRISRSKILDPYRISNPALIVEVEALWQHRAKKDHVFDALPRIVRSFWEDLGQSETPSWLGDYKVIEELGRGGMGVVFKAIQPAPLSRQVAIKVLPTALLTERWRARFEIEQQTLSSLSHPHIAAVYDAGVAEGDRPFLVMEWLDGLPITTYCDQHRLTLDARLDLFRHVCEGVGHAHGKGIIHLDLKPANILVIEQDGKAVPKIIDFGIAAFLLDGQEHEAGLGTPAYMSPEQASGDGSALDVQSDVYALGVILFELLAGKTPLDESLRQAGSFRERCRIVWETRTKTLAAQSSRLITAIASSNRGAKPRALIKRLRGELSDITSKALAHDSPKRYATCFQLLDDVRRYQANLPITAVTGRTWYPLRKWLAHHRWLVSAATMTVLAITTALIISLVSLRSVRASQAELRAVQKFSQNIFQKVSPYRRGPDVKAVELLDDSRLEIMEAYADQPNLAWATHIVLARSYRDLGFYTRAEEQFSAALALANTVRDPAETLVLRGERAYNLHRLGETVPALLMYEDAVAEAEDILGSKHATTLTLKSGKAYLLGQTRDFTASIALFVTVLSDQRATLGENNNQVLATTNNLVDIYLKNRQFADAERLARKALDQYQTTQAKPNPFTATLLHNLALALAEQDKGEEAVRLGYEALLIRQQLLGDHHPDSLLTANNLATAIGTHESAREAVSLIETVLAKLPETLQEELEVLRLRHNLGHFLMVSGYLSEAEAELRETWRLRKAQMTADHKDTLTTHFTLGEVLIADGRVEDGLIIMADAVETAEAALGPNDHFTKLLRNAWQHSKQVNTN